MDERNPCCSRVNKRIYNLLCPIGCFCYNTLLVTKLTFLKRMAYNQTSLDEKGLSFIIFIKYKPLHKRMYG